MRGRGLERFAWLFLAYLIAVILFGAWVRITGSGAGCGSHWPLCDGEVAPVNPGAEKLIEFTHRVTSGLCGVFGLILMGWAWLVDRRSATFRAACWTFFFILVEGGLGAMLVLEGLVADDASGARAFVVGLHLSNTLALTAAAALTAWVAGGRPVRLLDHAGGWRWKFGLALAFIMATSATGAVTALGDTLFPIEPAFGPGLLDKIGADISATNHFLVRMRALHPAVAVGTALYLLWILIPAARRRPGGWAAIGVWMVLVELVAGAVNVILAAPGWLQIIHLLLADIVWVATLLTGAEGDPAAAPEPEQEALVAAAPALK